MSEMEKYITKNSKDKLGILAAGAVFLVIAVVLLVQKTLFMGVIFAVLGVVAMYGGVTSGSVDKKAMQELEDMGLLNAAETDFAIAQDAAGGTIKLGEEFVFRKKNSTVLQYCDMAEVTYYETSTTDEHPHWYTKMAVTMKDGKLEPLCELYDADQVERAEQICELLTLRNSAIMVKRPDETGVVRSVADAVKKMVAKHKEE